jgi:hypothetical protein
MRRLTRGIGGRRAGDTESSMEFSDLLDDVAVQPSAPIPEPTTAIADLVMFRVSPRTDDTFAPPKEPAVEPAVDPVLEPVLDPVVELSEKITAVSRFADSGIEDDLLPVHTPSRRRLRR